MEMEILDLEFTFTPSKTSRMGGISPWKDDEELDLPRETVNPGASPASKAPSQAAAALSRRLYLGLSKNFSKSSVTEDLTSLRPASLAEASNATSKLPPPHIPATCDPPPGSREALSQLGNRQRCVGAKPWHDHYAEQAAAIKIERAAMLEAARRAAQEELERAPRPQSENANRKAALAASAASGWPAQAVARPVTSCGDTPQCIHHPGRCCRPLGLPADASEASQSTDQHPPLSDQQPPRSGLASMFCRAMAPPSEHERGEAPPRPTRSPGILGLNKEDLSPTSSRAVAALEMRRRLMDKYQQEEREKQQRKLLGAQMYEQQLGEQQEEGREHHEPRWRSASHQRQRHDDAHQQQQAAAATSASPATQPPMRADEAAASSGWSTAEAAAAAALLSPAPRPLRPSCTPSNPTSQTTPSPQTSRSSEDPLVKICRSLSPIRSEPSLIASSATSPAATSCASPTAERSGMPCASPPPSCASLSSSSSRASPPLPPSCSPSPLLVELEVREETGAEAEARREVAYRGQQQQQPGAAAEPASLIASSIASFEADHAATDEASHAQHAYASQSRYGKRSEPTSFDRAAWRTGQGSFPSSSRVQPLSMRDVMGTTTSRRSQSTLGLLGRQLDRHRPWVRSMDELGPAQSAGLATTQDGASRPSSSRVSTAMPARSMTAQMASQGEGRSQLPFNAARAQLHPKVLAVQQCAAPMLAAVHQTRVLQQLSMEQQADEAGRAAAARVAASYAANAATSSPQVSPAVDDKTAAPVLLHAGCYNNFSCTPSQPRAGLALGLRPGSYGHHQRLPRWASR